MASKPRDIERARQERRREINAAFARRHPEKARDERQLRQKQAQANRQAAAQRRSGRPAPESTPETREHVKGLHQGAIARLYERGHISIDQLAASQQIRTVVERIGRDVAVGMVSLEARVDNSRRPDAGFFESLAAVRAEVAYGRWRAWLGDRANLVLTMVVEDRACRSVAQQFGMRDQTVTKTLSAALDDWSEFLGEACDEIDEATLLAAQAGILMG